MSFRTAVETVGRLVDLLGVAIIVVGFVLGLGHLSRQFPEKSGSWRAARLAMSLAGDLVVHRRHPRFMKHGNCLLVGAG